MALDLGQTTQGSYGQGDIFSADAFPYITFPITIGSGENLKRGTPLGKKTADSKYYQFDSDASDGTETFVGVLTSDVDASESDEKAAMWITGGFNKQGMARKSDIATSLMPAANVYTTMGFKIVREEV